MLVVIFVILINWLPVFFICRCVVGLTNEMMTGKTEREDSDE